MLFSPEYALNFRRKRVLPENFDFQLLLHLYAHPWRIKDSHDAEQSKVDESSVVISERIENIG